MTDQAKMQTPEQREKRRLCYEQDVKTMTREELIEVMEILEEERKSIVEKSINDDLGLFQTEEDVRHAA